MRKKDSNLRQLSQSQLCCHYTIPQSSSRESNPSLDFTRVPSSHWTRGAKRLPPPDLLGPPREGQGPEEAGGGSRSPGRRLAPPGDESPEVSTSAEQLSATDLSRNLAGLAGRRAWCRNRTGYGLLTRQVRPMPPTRHHHQQRRKESNLLWPFWRRRLHPGSRLYHRQAGPEGVEPPVAELGPRHTPPCRPCNEKTPPLVFGLRGGVSGFPGFRLSGCSP